MALYKPKYRNKDGELVEVEGWWYAFRYRGQQIRESSGTKLKMAARVAHPGHGDPHPAAERHARRRSAEDDLGLDRLRTVHAGCRESEKARRLRKNHSAE